METQEPKQPELKATTFCMVCGTPCRMEPVTDNLDGEGSISYKYIPTGSVNQKLIDALSSLIPHCEHLLLEYNTSNVLNNAIKALKEAKAL